MHVKNGDTGMDEIYKEIFRSAGFSSTIYMTRNGAILKQAIKLSSAKENTFVNFLNCMRNFNPLEKLKENPFPLIFS